MSKQFRQAFVLRRDVDVTGVSGTGDIAEGAVFSDDSAVLCWKPLPGRGVYKSSIALWPDIPNMMGVHGHDGKTQIVWQPHTDAEQPLETFAFMDAELGVLGEGVRFSNGTVVVNWPSPYPIGPKTQFSGLLSVWPSLAAALSDAGTRFKSVMITHDRL